jgi:beta-N-acetylhexosaminidase
MTTLNYLPGYGAATKDPHQALPVVRPSLAGLRTRERVPFARGIAAGTNAVMTAHIAVSARAVKRQLLTKSPAVKATLLVYVVTGLLRGEMGFAGVIISDRLETRAMANTAGSAHGAVRTLAAGADLALVSHTPALQYAPCGTVRAARYDV